MSKNSTNKSIQVSNFHTEIKNITTFLEKEKEEKHNIKNKYYHLKKKFKKFTEKFKKEKLELENTLNEKEKKIKTLSQLNMVKGKVQKISKPKLKNYFPLIETNHPIPNKNRRKLINQECLPHDLEGHNQKTKEIFKKCEYAKNGSMYNSTYDDGFSIPYGDSFKIFLEFVHCQVPFALVRYGDGEHLLAKGISLDKRFQAFTRDKWTWDGGVKNVSIDLIASLHGTGNYFLGFSAPESFISALRWGVQNSAKTHDHRLYTLSLLFYLNFNGMVDFLDEIEKKKLAQKVILNQGLANISVISISNFSILLTDSFFDDGPNTYEKNRELILDQARSIAKAHQNSLFLMSGGPVAKILIHEMWKASKCNQYVDFGSFLDYYTKRTDFPNKIAVGKQDFKRWKYFKATDHFEVKENVPNAKAKIFKG
eukprot:gene10055-2479_t